MSYQVRALSFSILPVNFSRTWLAYPTIVGGGKNFIKTSLGSYHHPPKQREITHPPDSVFSKSVPQARKGGGKICQVFKKLASWDCGQSYSKTPLKELIFREAAAPVTLAVNYLTSVLHEFSLQFFAHLCFRALIFQKTFRKVFSVPVLVFP